MVVREMHTRYLVAPQATNECYYGSCSLSLSLSSSSSAHHLLHFPPLPPTYSTKDCEDVDRSSSSGCGDGISGSSRCFCCSISCTVSIGVHAIIDVDAECVSGVLLSVVNDVHDTTSLLDTGANWTVTLKFSGYFTFFFASL